MIQPSDQYIHFFRNYSEKLRQTDCMEETFDMLDRYMLLPSQAIYLLDWKQMNIPYKRGSKKLTGYDDDEFTLDLISGYIHPDDASRYVHLVKITNQYAREHKPTPFVLEAQIDYRIRKKDGSFIKVLRQSMIFEQCADKLPKSAINILTDISKVKTDNSVNLSLFCSYHGSILLEDNGWQHEFDKFSKRELEILRLLKQGKSSAQIAATLFISRHTVDTHRRKMLSKADCKNVTEMVHKASKVGIV